MLKLEILKRINNVADEQKKEKVERIPFEIGVMEIIVGRFLEPEVFPGGSSELTREDQRIIGASILSRSIRRVRTGLQFLPQIESTRVLIKASAICGDRVDRHLDEMIKRREEENGDLDKLYSGLRTVTDFFTREN